LNAVHLVGYEVTGDAQLGQALREPVQRYPTEHDPSVLIDKFGVLIVVDQYSHRLSRSCGAGPQSLVRAIQREVLTDEPVHGLAGEVGVAGVPAIHLDQVVHEAPQADVAAVGRVSPMTTCASVPAAGGSGGPPM
jgi:hypothetical protein